MRSSAGTASAVPVTSPATSPPDSPIRAMPEASAAMVISAPASSHTARPRQSESTRNSGEAPPVEATSVMACSIAPARGGVNSARSVAAARRPDGREAQPCTPPLFTRRLYW